MKLYNGPQIIVGLVIFLAIFTYPLWSNGGKAQPVPKPQLPAKKVATQCVAPLEYMRTSHMQLLNVWRDMVVRDGDRIYIAADGKHFNMSLTNTCLDCHASKVKFCDQCHNYLAVSPYCWDCHLVPKEKKVMGVDRREFIKLAGISAALGLGGAAGFQLLRPGTLDAAERMSTPYQMVFPKDQGAAQEVPNPKRLKGRRWGHGRRHEALHAGHPAQCHHGLPLLPQRSLDPHQEGDQVDLAGAVQERLSRRWKTHWPAAALAACPSS